MEFFFCFVDFLFELENDNAGVSADAAVIYSLGCGGDTLEVVVDVHGALKSAGFVDSEHGTITSVVVVAGSWIWGVILLSIENIRRGDGEFLTRIEGLDRRWRNCLTFGFLAIGVMGRVRNCTNDIARKYF